jgi:hypothetical protein
MFYAVKSLLNGFNTEPDYVYANYYAKDFHIRGGGQKDTN